MRLGSIADARVDVLEVARDDARDDARDGALEVVRDDARLEIVRDDALEEARDDVVLLSLTDADKTDLDHLVNSLETDDPETLESRTKKQRVEATTVKELLEPKKFRFPPKARWGIHPDQSALGNRDGPCPSPPSFPPPLRMLYKIPEAPPAPAWHTMNLPPPPLPTLEYK